jgi:hypothetical protein
MKSLLLLLILTIGAFGNIPNFQQTADIKIIRKWADQKLVSIVDIEKVKANIPGDTYGVRVYDCEERVYFFNFCGTVKIFEKKN